MRDPQLEALKAGLDNAIEHVEPKRSKCEHEYVFDILFSFANGDGEMYVCSRCGDRAVADDAWREEYD